MFAYVKVHYNTPFKWYSSQIGLIVDTFDLFQDPHMDLMQYKDFSPLKKCEF